MQSERELDTLTQLDRRSSDALLAIDAVAREVVGVVRFAALPDDPRVVDVAVTVGDRWQGRGLGGELLARLIDRARQEGHLALRASVLAENRRSIAMLQRAGFVSHSGTGVEREFELAFTQPPAPWRAPAVARRGWQRESPAPLTTQSPKEQP